MASGTPYDTALERLRAAARFGIHPSLDGIRAICTAMGEPQRGLACVQVAGTNGKTSTARVLSSLLVAHGCRTGLFTSPALGHRTEQIVIDGRPVTREAFAAAVEAAATAADTVGVAATEFELMTAAALWAFRQARVDWAVLEVGLGGRWDATSVVAPAIAVITGVDVDHAEHLGATREAIATEKAQIIREGSRAVVGPGIAGVLEVFMRRAQDVEAPITVVTQAPVAGDAVFEVSHESTGPLDPTTFALVTSGAFHDDLSLLAPSFQVANAAVAIVAAEAAYGALEGDRLTDGLLASTFPGRFEILADDPLVVADGAHNPAAAAVLAGAVREVFGADEPTIVLGVLEDKDAQGIVEALAGVASGFVVTASGSERSMTPEALADVVCDVTGQHPEVASDVPRALEVARMRGSVVATGSLTIAAEARVSLKG